MGVRAIGEQVGMHFNQVAKCRRRYLRGGLGRCRMSRARAAKVTLARRSCARRSGHAATPGPGAMDLPPDGSHI